MRLAPSPACYRRWQLELQRPDSCHALDEPPDLTGPPPDHSGYLDQPDQMVDLLTAQLIVAHMGHRQCRTDRLWHGCHSGAAVSGVYCALKTLDKALLPWIVASQTVPVLAIAPIVLIILGSLGITGLLPKAVIAMYLCFFPVTVAMVQGLRSPQRLEMELLHTYATGKVDTFWLLRLPASLPFLFPAFRVAIASGLVGTMVAELPTGAQAGLGARLLTGHITATRCRSGPPW